MVYETPVFRPMGDRSLLVELGEKIAPDVNRRVQELMLKLQQARLPGVREFAPGYRSLLVVFDPLALSPSELKARITDVARPGSTLPQPLPSVPVFYGGEYGPD
jgi:allophanate hydrolase subunit 1